jgi:hypothetical protein
LEERWEGEEVAGAGTAGIYEVKYLGYQTLLDGGFLGLVRKGLRKGWECVRVGCRIL